VVEKYVKKHVFSSKDGAEGATPLLRDGKKRGQAKRKGGERMGKGELKAKGRPFELNSSARGKGRG
jgi:hypothetical protein